MTLHALFWAPALATSIHVLEEFVMPGGFLEWHRWYRPEQATSITPRFALVANGLLLLLCLAAVINGPSLLGIGQWLAAAAILFTNALFHVRAVLRTRVYSPGVVTAVLLYIPLALYGYYSFLRTGLASPATAIVAFLLGGSYPFVSRLLHEARSRSGPSRGARA